jgi:hypothetical protein
MSNDAIIINLPLFNPLTLHGVMFLFLQFITTGFVCYGMYYATRVKYSVIENRFTQKEIFWFVKWYGDQYLTEWLRKPLYDCPICMASFWTITTSLLFFGLDFTALLVIPAAAGMNYVLSRLFPYSED